jgi:predicted DNA-binding transcriptional regulator AlpA
MPGEQAAEVTGLVEQIAAAIRTAAAAPQPQMFCADDAAAYCGISRAALYRLRAAERFPAAVKVEGVDPRWRRADLDRWIAGLKPGRRKTNAV